MKTVYDEEARFNKKLYELGIRDEIWELNKCKILIEKQQDELIKESSNKESDEISLLK